MGAGTEEIDLLATIDPKSGERVWNTHLTPQSNQVQKTLYAKPQAVIPIVFLPGIMGTNLKARGQGGIVWRPPNGIVDGLSSVFTWIWRGPKTRQAMLDLRAVEVDSSGPIRVGNSGLSDALARERGWGTVIMGSYHPVMILMQKALNDIAFFSAGTPLKDPDSRITIQKEWKDSRMVSPSEYGEVLGLEALEKEELVKAALYQFDVWCAGYNWLQSNRDSGEDVKKYIDETVLKHYRDKQVPASKVILVTHSMGGLVSRALTELHHYDKVLGVVHGVQPSTGAPAFYHHARCGYEGAAQVVLGRNAGEVTSVVANAPGALELAPSFDYDDGKPWLFLSDTRTKASASLPASGNPYTEIYANPAWYGLVPQENSKYLDMSKSGGSPKSNSRHVFNKNLFLLSEFHRDIAGKYFSPTHIHYGAESTRHSWQSIEWKGNFELIGNGYSDNENGAYSRYEATTVGMGVPVMYSVKGVELFPGPYRGGDGTVPERSGVAPERVGVKSSFRHGDTGNGQYSTHKGYEHQDSYLDRRSQWATLYGVIKIAQLADWHE